MDGVLTQIYSINFQLNNLVMQFENIKMQMQNMGIQYIYPQIQNIGIQIINMGIQIINISFYIPDLGFSSPNIISKQKLVQEAIDLYRLKSGDIEKELAFISNNVCKLNPNLKISETTLIEGSIIKIIVLAGILGG